MKNTFFGWLALALIISSLITLFPVTGETAELRDYRLPSEKKQGGYPAGGSEAQKADSYREFRLKVGTLTPAQKKQLRENFCKKLQSTNKVDEKNYYINLIKILDESERPR